MFPLLENKDALAGLTAFLITVPDPEAMEQAVSTTGGMLSSPVIDLCASPPSVLTPNDPISTQPDIAGPTNTNKSDAFPANPGPSHGEEKCAEEYHDIDLHDLLDLDKPMAPMTTEERGAVDKMLEEGKK